MNCRIRLIGFLILIVLGISTENASAQWQGTVATQTGKLVGKVAGKQVVNKGSQQTCVYPFICAKIAGAPGSTIQPRGQSVPPIPTRPHRRRN